MFVLALMVLLGVTYTPDAGVYTLRAEPTSTNTERICFASDGIAIGCVASDGVAVAELSASLDCADHIITARAINTIGSSADSVPGDTLGGPCVHLLVP